MIWNRIQLYVYCLCIQIVMFPLSFVVESVVMITRHRSTILTDMNCVFLQSDESEHMAQTRRHHLTVHLSPLPSCLFLSALPADDVLRERCGGDASSETYWTTKEGPSRCALLFASY